MEGSNYPIGKSTCIFLAERSGRFMVPWIWNVAECNSNEFLNAKAVIALLLGSIHKLPGCSRPDYKTPDGYSLVPNPRAKSLLWDFTCTDTFALSYLDKTSRTLGYAMQAEARKSRYYDGLVDHCYFC